jgi:50S ribosomal subunit-associated GTPase HflX
MLTVYNKADLLSSAAPEEEGLLVSAVTGEGLDRLISEVVHQVSPVRI